MKDAPLLESRVCQYENSPDNNFIIDRHPKYENVWLLGGGLVTGSVWSGAGDGGGIGSRSQRPCSHISLEKMEFWRVGDRYWT